MQSTHKRAEPPASGGIGGSLDTQPALIFVGSLLWLVRAPPQACDLKGSFLCRKVSDTLAAVKDRGFRRDMIANAYKQGT
ncbi:hypothetical protein PoB_003317400 [Plakobranchus ocellatus]|uniref:Uncharacterized protein n=1 Tax=Plakobranchus ocellatus TaxID=259542 RepID=A0AAV4AJS2_9GAST|nr:hypothetical protein PoB_003317400 [Plakobranchus ocellatus]